VRLLREKFSTEEPLFVLQVPVADDCLSHAWISFTDVNK
jgi:hypothetical protein